MTRQFKAPSLSSYDQVEWRGLEEMVLNIIPEHERLATIHDPA